MLTISRWLSEPPPCESRRRCRERLWSGSKYRTKNANAFSCARFSKPTNFHPRRASLQSRSARISPGRPVAADLAKMPHLLIAGATGTGKSVSLHTMIASILFNATADDVRLILVDPKMLELSVYENIPHLLVPVVVDPQKAASALLWATQEMEGRYLRMRELGRAQYRRLQPCAGVGRVARAAQDGGAERARVGRSESAGGRHDRASQAAEDRDRYRRAGRLAAERGQDRRARYHAAGAKGARRGDSSDSRDAAAVGRT